MIRARTACPSYIQLRVREDRDEVGFVEEALGRAEKIARGEIKLSQGICSGRAPSSTRSVPTRRCGWSSPSSSPRSC
jgi:hypothetical protein